jgi:hypothetical protein
MSTQPNQLPQDISSSVLGSEITRLQNMLKSLTAQLMSQSQTVQELIMVNMKLKADLILAQSDKNGLDQHMINQLKEPVVPVKASESDVPEDEAVKVPVDNGAVQDDLIDKGPNADTVSA